MLGDAGRLRLTGEQRRLYWVVAAAFFNFQFLLPVAPLLVARGGSLLGPGLTTAAFMGATVVTQVAMPLLTRRAGLSSLTVASALLLGLPSFVYLASHALAAVLVASVLRGMGFGIASVTLTALVIRMVSFDQRSAAIGRFGLVAGLIGALAPAAGLRLYTSGLGMAVFVCAGLLSVLAVGLIPFSLLSRMPAESRPSTVMAALRRPELARPAIVFALAVTGYGAVVSYLPAAFQRGASPMLLAFGLAQAISRGFVGRVGDGRVRRSLIWAAPPAALAGLLCLWAATSRTSAGLGYVGLILLGIGAGTLATECLAQLSRRGADRSLITAAAVWNIAFDAGIAIGGAVVAVRSGPGGISQDNVICAALLAAAVAIAVSDRQHARSS